MYERTEASCRCSFRFREAACTDVAKRVGRRRIAIADNALRMTMPHDRTKRFATPTNAQIGRAGAGKDGLLLTAFGRPQIRADKRWGSLLFTTGSTAARLP